MSGGALSSAIAVIILRLLLSQLSTAMHFLDVTILSARVYNDMTERYNPAAEAVKEFGMEAANALLADVLPDRHKTLLNAAITVGLRDGDIQQELALMEAFTRTCDLAEQLFPLATALGAPREYPGDDDSFYGWLVANIDNLVVRNPENNELAEIRTLHARRLIVD